MINLINKLERKNIYISLVGDKLELSYDDEIDNEILQEIKANKEALIKFLKKYTDTKKYEEIKAVEEQANYPLSDAQKRLWILSQFDKGSVAYNMPLDSVLDGNYDIENFKKAIDATINRHEILRTVFREDASGEIRQWVLATEELNFTIDYQDFRNEKDKKSKAAAYIQEDAVKEFDLANGPLIRASLLQTEDDQYVFYYNMHHIISDGWSMDILSRDVLAYYTSYETGTPVNLPELRIQYKDYATWQLSQLEEASSKKRREYWMQQFSGTLPVIDLPASKKRPAVKTSNGRRLGTYVSKEVTEALKGFCKENGGILYMGLITTFNALLYKYTSQKDFILGTPVAGRDHMDLEDQMGFYVNTLALRNQIEEEDNFQTLFDRVKETTLGAYEHQQYPFDRLVEDLQLKRDLSRSVIFDIMVSLQNIGGNEAIIDPQKVDTIVDYGQDASKFDIEVSFKEIGGCLSFETRYNTDIYSKSMIESFMMHFKQLLSEVVYQPEQLIAQIDFLSSEEKKILLKTFNETQTDYPNNVTVLDEFYHQVSKNPQHTAILFEGKELTYNELDVKSNQLANLLLEKGVTSGQLLPISVNRSIEMIVGILGVLKAGATYVPIDPSYPESRIHYILEDISSTLLLSTTTLADTFDKIDVIHLDTIDYEEYSEVRPEFEVQPTQNAYVIYTSGTTGNPKGTLISHGALYNYICYASNSYSQKNPLRYILCTSFSFDLTITTLFTPLVTGGVIDILPSFENQIEVLELVSKSDFDVIKLTPSQVNVLVEMLLNDTPYQGKEQKTFIIGGEALQPETVSLLFSYYGEKVTIWNEYGPTESTVGCISNKIESLESNSTSIGKPTDNISIYILNENKDLAPIGVIGEIYIGGNQLAKGYVNQPQLTKERFIENPFVTGERLYKTGDLGKWALDGTIDFLGRKDDQVKIRGYRIELGEIESKLLAKESIKEVTVQVFEIKGEKQLAAYFVSNQEEVVSELRTFLSKEVPNYMVPGTYVQLDSMPLTNNGKIDTSKLPALSVEQLSSEVEYVAPTTNTEKIVVGVWEELLHRNPIGLNDNFFDLGGHSIKIAKLINVYQKMFGVKLGFSELFQNTSLVSHLDLIANSIKSKHEPIEKAEIAESYPLSDAQHRLWVLSQFEENSIAYNMPTYHFLSGNYTLENLEKAIKATIDRHEILRTVFRENESGAIRQYILSNEEVNFAINTCDLRDVTDQKQAVEDFVQKDTNRLFDLENGPLLRATLLQLSEEQYVFYYNMHHIIGDGWSMDILVKDVLAFYEALEADEEPSIAPLKIQYKDYAIWQLKQLEKEDVKEQKEFWLGQFSGELPLLNLPTAQKRPLLKTTNGKCLGTYLSKDLSNQLKDFCQDQGGSLFMGLVASLNTLFHRYTAQEDFIIGSPVAGRDHIDLEDQIGFYVNTLPLRNQVKPLESFKTLFENVKLATLKAYEYQQYSFDRLVEDLDLKRDVSRSVLFDVMVNLNNVKDTETPLVTETLDSIVDYGAVVSKFDIDFSFKEVGEYISLSVKYNSDVYDQHLMETFIKHYKLLLNALLENTDQSVGLVDYLSTKEKDILINEFNDTYKESLGDTTVLDLFEKQVIEQPNAVAVVFENTQVTYKELDERSNQIANSLVESGLEKETLVPICIHRSLEMIIGILGIMKAGGAYVPIDPSYPKARIDFMLEDSGAKIIVSQASLLDVLQTDQEHIILCVDDTTSLSSKTAKVNINVTGENLAYSIYTSGTTGTPKGVLVEHKGFMNYIAHQLHYFSMTNEENVLLFSNYVFDASIEQIFISLSSGATLYIPEYDTIMDSEKIGAYLEDHSITHLHATPSFLELVPEKEYPSLKRVVSGGEACSVNLVNKWRDGIVCINKYGPTEVTITTLMHTITAEDKLGTVIPIGKPIDNTSCYILSESEMLVPVGVIGELCLSGTQVARGYLNRPDLTAEKFVFNRFRESGNLYKTGDLARWLPDGSVEYMGRKDDQVKIRGHRIELAEIELRLEELSEVDQVVVIAKEGPNGLKRLVTYVVGEAFDKHKAVKELAQKLPEYMIPQLYVVLDTFPLTTNGKIDKRALPEPEDFTSSSEKFVAPQTHEQIVLASIWQEVLGVKEVSIYDNFFSMGGDSIMAIQLVSRAKKKGVVLKVRDIFTNQTIYEIAKNLKTDVTVISEQGILEGTSGLLPIHHSFFEKEYVNYNHYNQSVLLTLSKDVDVAILTKAVTYLMQQHDALRLKYEKTATGYQGVYQTTIPDIAVKSLLDTDDSIDEEITQICEFYQENIAIEKGDIAKFVIIETPPSDEFNRLFMVAHHLVVDGISWRVLVEDLSSYITALMSGKEVVLEEKTTSYRQWQERLKEYADSRELLSELPYWKSIIAKTSVIPQDTAYEEATVYTETDTFNIQLTKEETQSLLQECHHAYGTEINDLLLTALSVSLSEWSGMSETVIGLEGHGREDIFDDVDLSKTAGWFTSLYPLLLSDKKELALTLVETKEALRAVPNKGIGYGVLRYLSSEKDVRSDLSKDIEQIKFNYLGQFGNNQNEEGLFDFAFESKGNDIGAANKISSKLIINGSIVQDVLRFTWVYDTNRYHEATIATIADRFKASLLEIITLCTSIDTPIATPYDHGLNGLVTYDELSAFKQSNHPYAIEDVYKFSPLQEGLLFHSLYNEDANAYVVQLSFDMVGDLQLDFFKEAWELLLKKHSTLRTSFYYETMGVPVQCVYNHVDIPITVVSYEDKSSGELEQDIATFLEGDANTPFDLEVPPLFRLTLLKIADDRTKLVFTHHHLLFDGWSLPIIFSEFISSYQTLVDKKTLHTNVKKDNYKDYIKYIQSKDQIQTLTYWEDHLQDLEEPTLLPFINKKKDRNKTFGNQNLILSKGSDYVKQLESFAQSNHITINTIVQGVWSYLLSRYTRNSVVAFGTVISGRPTEIEDIETRVGLYINTIPLCTAVQDDMKVVDWLVDLQKKYTTSREEYGHSSLSQIQKVSAVSGELFDSMMVFENYPVESIQSVKTDLAIENIKGKEQTNYALTLAIGHASERELSIDFGYNSTLISEEDIKRIHAHFNELLDSIIQSNTVEELNYLTTSERKELLEDFNATGTDYNLEQTVLDLFLENVNQYPDEIALLFEDTQLTFKELDVKTNQLANFLVEQGVEKENLIPICIDRSLEMVIGILAILKVGGAYVPIDPRYPQERIQYILEDTHAKLVVSSKEHASAIQVLPVVCLDDFTYESYATTFSGDEILPNQLAYCIYTSGTTGNPKGVLNEHQALVNRLLWMRDELTIDTASVILQKTTYTFDVSVWELIMPLIVGCKMVLARPEGHKDPSYMQDVIEGKEVTIVHFVPSMLGMFLEDLGAGRCQELQHIVCSGEALSSALVSKTKEKLGTTRIHNLYGPTEAAIDVTSVDLTFVDTEKLGVTIGSPVANTQLYIVNKAMEIQPVGVAGELLIGGVQVARGYLNRPELTAEKFVFNRFRESGNLYKTGDLARWLPNGSIEYLGRIDRQVKIRGYRIELGEIENQLEQLPTLKQAVIVAKENEYGSKQLVAYVINENDFNEKETIATLKENLPEYMVPQVFVKLDSFPLTANGKINTKALPDPETSDLSFEEYVAPATPIQEQLATIWQEDLKIEKIGIKDNYFMLGGDSIKMIRLVSKIKKSFNIQFPIASFYENPTIEDLSLFIEEFSQDNTSNYEALVEEAKTSLEAFEYDVLKDHPLASTIANVYPLSDIQLGMIVTSQLMRNNGELGIYHDQFLFQLALLDIELLKQAMRLLVNKHETLRTSYHLSDYEQQVQIIYNEIPIEINSEDLRTIEDKKGRENYIQGFLTNERENHPFDVTKAPLWRINLFQINETEIIFVFQFHHAILDGWSEKNIRKELFEIYESLKVDENYRPMPLKCSMEDSIISDILERKNERNITYWKSKMTNYNRLDIFTNENQTDSVSKGYGKEFKDNILKKCTENGITLKALFFSGYVYCLSMLSSKKDVTVGMVSHRRPFVEDGDKLMGCFLNTVPFRFKNEFSKESSWLDYIKAIEIELQELKGKDRISLLDISQLVDENTIDENPFFDTIFNYVDFHVLHELIEDEKFIATQSDRENESFSHESFETTNTFLDVSVNLTGDFCSITIKNKRMLRSNHTLKDLMVYYDNFLQAFLKCSDNKINTLDIIPEAEQHKLLEEFNTTKVEFPSDKTVIDLFSDQVLKTPDAIALVFDNKEFTYNDVDVLSNQLANYLLSKYAIGLEDLIAVKLERSEWLVISLLAVLKCGAAYVPIDPNYPEQRIKYIEDDSNSKITITTSLLDAFNDVDGLSEERPDINMSSSNLAYIIYTSGSTGKPKGVMIEHRSLVNLCYWHINEYQLDTSSRSTLFAGIGFDASVWEIYPYLLSGGSLYPIADKNVRYNINLLVDFLNDNAITHAYLPTKICEEFVAQKVDLQNTKIVTGGEALRLPNEPINLNIYNNYGPSENTIVTTSFDLIDRTGEVIPIGRPISNTEVYILSEDLELQPIGVEGELCISGEGLSRGYLYREELTSDKFVAHPFKKGERLYKTGDLARWLSDGTIEYIGRNDDQLKIRGYRVELGEIANHLALKESVSKVAIVTENEGVGKQIVAYFVSEVEEDVNELNMFLSESLPDYMIPDVYIQLDTIPLNENGKLDKDALAQIKGVKLSKEIPYVAPENDIQEKLASICQELLQRERIGIRDNFFMLGGNSLRAIQFTSRVSKEFNVKIDFVTLFSNPTIEKLASEIENSLWANNDLFVEEEVSDFENISI
ncbi:hypothetical protein GCM10011344_26200 [Dokdonia pacifica]|uniref:Bacitracin synthase 3 n=1 Tax=Dokdonia pacifica TaxID=1627892 RepID=A0A239E3J5_9FLAO|nr:non-ribosomal peptide synthetase [Dokdonia pacifica]GGG24223.1 hypothetical protein GCM10011344_26200 [Dokdonia pacifica]SNS39167.1 bacitracin synthase 3 [Dokdonia pacifica]